MKPLKFLFALSLLPLCLALPANAQFQGGLAGSQNVALTNKTILASAANTWILPNSTGATNTTSGAVAPSIKLNNGQNLAVQLSGAGTNTSTANVILYFVDSPDNTHWSTIPAYQAAVAMNGNNAVVSPMTNFLVGAKLYLAPWYMTNASGDVMFTNATVRLVLKPGY